MQSPVCYKMQIVLIADRSGFIANCIGRTVRHALDSVTHAAFPLQVISGITQTELIA